jgi:hypothetical protein
MNSRPFEFIGANNKGAMSSPMIAGKSSWCEAFAELQGNEGMYAKDVAAP